MSHAPEQLEMWSVGAAHEKQAQPRALALATGSACLATAMPLGKRMLLRDAPAILWRALGEDLNKRMEHLSK